MVSRLLGTSVMVKVTLIIWLLSVVFVMVLVNKIDGIVHGELYDYGLQFSLNWAVSYWAFLRLLYVCLAVPSVLSIVVLGSDLVKRFRNSQNASANGVKPSNYRVQTAKENSMIINCPNCQKMFSKPLTMLDFGTGKAKLVSVCPYCSHVLGRADEKKPDNIQVLEPEKEEVH
jgi:uncharacterized Zn-finger protein